MTLTATSGPALRLRYAALSDVGRVPQGQPGLRASPASTCSSSPTASAVPRAATSPAPPRSRSCAGSTRPRRGDLLEALAGAIHRAHDRIAELVDEDPELEGTSTTVTAALFDGHRIGVGHVGDSRGYLLRDGELRQLTKDHTFVQSLIDEGRITEEESRSHPHRNLILRAVDGVHETDPDLFTVDLARGRPASCSAATAAPGPSTTPSASPTSSAAAPSTTPWWSWCVPPSTAGSTDNVTVRRRRGGGRRRERTSADTSRRAHHRADAGRRRGRAAAPRRSGRSVAASSAATAAATPASSSRSPARRAGAEVDPEELRYAPRAPGRFVWLRRTVLIALSSPCSWRPAATAAYSWTQSQYYVAADGDYVAIYQGIQADLPGLTLSTLH